MLANLRTDSEELRLTLFDDMRIALLNSPDGVIWHQFKMRLKVEELVILTGGSLMGVEQLAQVTYQQHPDGGTVYRYRNGLPAGMFDEVDVLLKDIAPQVEAEVKRESITFPGGDRTVLVKYVQTMLQQGAQHRRYNDHVVLALPTSPDRFSITYMDNEFEKEMYSGCVIFVVREYGVHVGQTRGGCSNTPRTGKFFVAPGFTVESLLKEAGYQLADYQLTK